MHREVGHDGMQC